MVTDRGLTSQTQTTADRLRARASMTGSWLCIGLDPDLRRLPDRLSPDAQGVTEFCGEIIAATSHLACAYKINFAFFEALGPTGWQALAEVRGSIPTEAVAIADAKRGDIGNTARAYATAIFDSLGFDGVTVNPYLGLDALDPFFAYSGRLILVLCRTSNTGQASMQDVVVNGEPLYLHVARDALARVASADIGLVVGGTDPAALRAVRSLSQDVVLLVPGIGAQGADALESRRAGANSSGANALFSVSRDIIFASRGQDYAAAARSAAEQYAEMLRTRVGAIGTTD